MLLTESIHGVELHGKQLGRLLRSQPLFGVPQLAMLAKCAVDGRSTLKSVKYPSVLVVYVLADVFQISGQLQSDCHWRTADRASGVSDELYAQNIEFKVC